MKLLEPKAQGERMAGEEAMLISRTEELRKAEKQYRQRLAKAEAEFNGTLAKNRTAWEQEVQAHGEWKKQKESEVAYLEGVAKKNSEPVTLKLKEAETKKAEAKLLGAENKKRQAELEEVAEKLQDQLDGLGEREQSVALRERQAAAKEKGIEEQGANIRLQAENLTKSLQLAAQEREQEDRKLKAERESLYILKRTVDSLQFEAEERCVKLDKRELKLDAREKEVVKREKEAQKPVAELELKLEKALKEVKKKEKGLSERESALSKMEFNSTEAQNAQETAFLEMQGRLGAWENALKLRSEAIEEAERQMGRLQEENVSQARNLGEKEVLLAGKEGKLREEYEAKNATLLVREAQAAAVFDKAKEMEASSLELKAEAELIRERANKSLEEVAVSERKNVWESETLARDRTTLSEKMKKSEEDTQRFFKERDEFESYRRTEMARIEKGTSDLREELANFHGEKRDYTAEQERLADWDRALKRREQELQRAAREVG